MTRPSDVKPREDEKPGSEYSEWEIGTKLPDLAFEITPDICKEYAIAVGGNADGYMIDGRPAALPSVFAVYLLAVLYRKYHPQQGGVVIDTQFSFFNPVWADETTAINAAGQVDDKFEKRGRKYIKWSAVFSNGAGQKVASAQNTIAFPG